MAGALGLGAMRLSTAEGRNDGLSGQVLTTALAQGVLLFDTSPAYASGELDLHHNERLLALHVRAPGVRISTKAGLTRRGTEWVPDGRRKAIERSAEASASILGRPLDVLLLHAVDARVALSTSMRALEGLRRAGVARALGICTARRDVLEEALSHAQIEVVQLPLSVFDDQAIRSGVLASARARGLEIHAHTPLGGPNRAKRIDGDPRLAALAARHGVSPVAVALAWVVAHGAVPLVGASRVETAAMLGMRLPELSPDAMSSPEERVATTTKTGDEVVLLVGSQGSGKSTLAAELVARGHERFNRDERGGTIRGLSRALHERLLELRARGETGRFVVDNTHPTRAERALMVGASAGASVRAIVLETPMTVARANVVRRIVKTLGRLPTPEELRKSRDPSVVPPSALFGFARAWEAPTEDEGLTIETRAFERQTSGTHAGVAIALGALERASEPALARARAGRALVYGWAPSDEPATARTARLELDRLGLFHAELAFCSHPGGPPSCWCRPPLPGLVVAWLVRADIDASRSLLVGEPRNDRAIAEGAGLTFEAVATV